MPSIKTKVKEKNLLMHQNTRSTGLGIKHNNAKLMHQVRL